MTATSLASAAPGKSSLGRVMLASAIGSALEWYDFFIYGTAAALVFNELFFPKLDPWMGTLAAFATFGVGFFARPFGGLVFGHFGDRLGRKPMLVATLLLVGVATFLIGLVPSYNQIGIWAPVLLVVLRLLQGFGAGAEYGGAVIFAVEYAPAAKRGLFGSWAPIGVTLGNLMIAGMSNEEWSSALRSIPYPFKTASKGTQLQIWHASHGRYETQSPVRTFVPYTIDNKQYLLAAYTCTPLVKIPVSDLKAGAQVKGVTITDLGSGNQPLDMVPYSKDGHEYILIANSSFGVVKLHADNLGQYKPIESPTVVDVAGAPYDKIGSLTNVRHLTSFDSANAVILTSAGGGGFAPRPIRPKTEWRSGVSVEMRPASTTRS